jgi:hypothetical protein
MGKIILEFDSIEESVEARNALDGTKWKIAMWNLDQKLRGMVKHGYAMNSNRELTDDEHKLAQQIRDELHRILNQANLDLEN